jgi:hypothetical protein
MHPDGRALMMRKLTALAATALATLAASAAMGSGNDAEAYTQYGAKNPSMLGKAVYYKAAGSSNFWQSTINVAGPTVYRSRTYAGTQTVRVTRYIYKTSPTNWGELYNGWSLADSRTTSAPIRPGYRRTFSSWNFQANPFFNYRVVLKVSYYTAAGRFLSSILTDYNHTGDYQCDTDNCSVLAGRDGRASMLLMY